MTDREEDAWGYSQCEWVERCQDAPCEELTDIVTEYDGKTYKLCPTHRLLLIEEARQKGKHIRSRPRI